MSWLSLWPAILGVILTAILAFALHTLDVDRIQAANATALEDQKNKLTLQCNEAKQITEASTSDYQNRISALDQQLDQLKRMRQPTCVFVQSSSKAGIGAHSSAKPELPRQDVGVTSTAFYDYARDAEAVRIQLQSCQGFISKVYELNGK